MSEAAHVLLREIAEQSQTSMSAIIELALHDYRRRLFWATARREFEALRSDATFWRSDQAEAEVWDVSIADGLDSDDER